MKTKDLSIPVLIRSLQFRATYVTRARHIWRALCIYMYRQNCGATQPQGLDRYPSRNVQCDTRRVKRDFFGAMESIQPIRPVCVYSIQVIIKKDFAFIFCGLKFIFTISTENV